MLTWRAVGVQWDRVFVYRQQAGSYWIGVGPVGLRYRSSPALAPIIF